MLKKALTDNPLDSLYHLTIKPIRYWCFFLLFGWLVQPVYGQKLVRRFAGSVVVLTSGDTLRGPLSLYSDDDMIVLRRADGSLRTYTSWMVKSFAVKGELTRFSKLLPTLVATDSLGELEQVERVLTKEVDTTEVRLFTSYRVKQHSYGRCTPGFYEILCEGPVCLLRREEWRMGTVREYTTKKSLRVPHNTMVTQAYLVGSLFLFTPDGQLMPLRRPRRDLAALLPMQAAALERYSEQHQLDFAKPDHLRTIVRYANELLTTRP